MKLKVTNIEWDTSDFTEEEELQSGCCVPDLPSEAVIDDVQGFSSNAELEGFARSYLEGTYLHEITNLHIEIIREDEPPVVSVERQARFILTDLNHLINYARGCARSKRAGQDIDDEGMDIIRSLRGLFKRLGITPGGAFRVIPRITDTTTRENKP